MWRPEWLCGQPALAPCSRVRGSLCPVGLSCLRQGPDRLTPLPLCPCLFLTLSGARRWLVAQTHTGPCHHCGDPGVAMSLVHSRGALRGGLVRLQRGKRPGPAAAEGREAADPEGVSLRNSSRPCAPVLAGPPPNPPCSPASRTHLRGPAPPAQSSHSFLYPMHCLPSTW